MRARRRSEINAALTGQPLENSFLAEDAAVLHANFAQQWGPLFRLGKRITTTGAPQMITLPRSGTYILDGSAIEIEGRLIRHGQSMYLDEGVIEVIGAKNADVVLWHGSSLPDPPPFEWEGEFYTNY